MKPITKERSNKALPQFEGRENILIGLELTGSNLVHIAGQDSDATADLRVNFEKAWLPFEDESVKAIYSHKFFSRLQNFIPFMNECHRVLARNGELCVTEPIYPAPAAYDDPRTVRTFTKNTWLHFVESDPFYQVHGLRMKIKPFRMIHFSQDGQLTNIRLVK